MPRLAARHGGLLPLFAFVAYAALVWYLAARWRRGLWAFIAVLGGIVGLVFVAILHYQLNIWTHGAIYLPVMQVILYPYTALVGMVGVFIACLPRRLPGALECRSCGYDLTGLEEDIRACPECNAEVPELLLPAHAPDQLGLCRACQEPIERWRQPLGVCPSCSATYRAPAAPPRRRTAAARAATPDPAAPTIKVAAFLAAQHPPQPADEQDQQR